jgi:transcriptional regulator with XRE-family HTH domain
MLCAVVLRENQYCIWVNQTMTANTAICHMDHRTELDDVGPEELGKVEENFPRNLKALMVRMDISQAQLARGVGVSPSTVSLWLSAKQMASSAQMNGLVAFLRLPDPGLLIANSIEGIEVFATEDDAIDFLARRKRERELDNSRQTPGKRGRPRKPDPKKAT